MRFCFFNVCLFLFLFEDFDLDNAFFIAVSEFLSTTGVTKELDADIDFEEEDEDDEENRER